MIVLILGLLILGTDSVNNRLILELLILGFDSANIRITNIRVW